VKTHLVKDRSQLSILDATLHETPRCPAWAKFPFIASGASQAPGTVQKGIQTMQACDAIRTVRGAAAPVVFVLLGLQAFVSAAAQAATAAAPAAPPVQLQSYTAPDQSVTAGVPSGWNVKNAAGGQINMSGPQGEAINIDVFIAQDGTFQLGQKGPGVAVVTMPSSAKLTDKLTMFVEQQEALAGSPAAQVKFLYAAPLQSPPAGVQCGMFVIAISAIPTPSDGMGIFCSLPDDSAHLFKIVLFMGTAPTAIAAKTEPTVLAVFKSYKPASGLVQKMFGPYTAPPAASAASAATAAAETNAYLRAIAVGQYGSDVGFACADANIIGTPNRQVARECGGWEPSF
jgi:hypothetical protein